MVAQAAKNEGLECHAFVAPQLSRHAKEGKCQGMARRVSRPQEGKSDLNDFSDEWWLMLKRQSDMTSPVVDGFQPSGPADFSRTWTRSALVCDTSTSSRPRSIVVLMNLIVERCIEIQMEMVLEM